MRFPLSLSLSPFRVGFVIIISRHPFFIFFSNSLAFVPLCSWPRHVNQPARYQRPLVLIDQALDRRRQWFENTRMHSGVKGGILRTRLSWPRSNPIFSLRVVQRFMLCIGCRETKYGVEFCCIFPSILQAG